MLGIADRGRGLCGYALVGEAADDCPVPHAAAGPPAAPARILTAGKLDDALLHFVFLSMAAGLGPTLVLLAAAGRVEAGSPPAIVYFWTACVSAALGVPLLIALGLVARRLLRLRVALEAELVTAAELDRLMLHGWRTFHDLPDERCGNLDHVLVGVGGIYVVETKGYLMGRGKGDWVAKADAAAGTLTLGGRVRPFPAAQLRRNADVLGRVLTERLGEPPPVPVEPLLCLPGWRVESTSPATPRAMNPENALGFVTKPRLTGPLTPGQVDKLARSLDDLCRSVRPALSTRTGER